MPFAHNSPQSFIRSAAAGLKEYIGEAHRFERNASYLKPHQVAVSPYLQKVGRSASLFVPFVVIFFGWPMATKYLIDMNNGVNKPLPLKRNH